MAQMGAAAGADNLVPAHSQAVVTLRQNAVFCQRLPETRPAGSRVKLRVRAVKIIAAGDAFVGAFPLRPRTGGKTADRFLLDAARYTARE